MKEDQLSEGIAYAKNIIQGSKHHLHLDQDYLRQNFDLSGKKVLDFGCGMGGMTIWLSRQWDCAVTGVDIDSHHIQVAKELLKNYPDSKVNFELRNVLEKPIDEKFDVILINDVVEHIPMSILSQILAQLRGCLNEHGQIFISYPPWESPYASHLNHVLSIPWVQFLPQKMVLSMLEKKNRTLVGTKDLKQEYLELNHLNHRRFMKVVDDTSLKVAKRTSHSKLKKFGLDVNAGLFKYFITKELLVLQRG